MANLEAAIARMTPVSPGMPPLSVLTAERINALQDAIRALARGENIQFDETVSKSSGGSWVKLAAKQIDNAPGIDFHRWQVSITSSSNNLVVEMAPGKLNGLVPSDIFDTKPLTNRNGTNYVSLVARTDGKNINRVTWEVTGSQPAPQTAQQGAAPSEFRIVVAVIHLQQVWQIEGDNITMTPEVVFTMPKEPDYPGGEAFTRYWKWQ